MELDPYLMPCTKINPKQVKKLNLRVKTVKLLEKNEGNSHGIGFYNLMDLTTKTQAIN